MSNRLYNQFSYSPERQPINLMGSFTVAVAQVKASKVLSGITYTAKAFGTSGNSITIALTAGGTAGAEVVTVVGSAISVQIESGVSTRTQVKAAIDGNVGAAALIAVSVSSGATPATLVAATALTGGVATSFTSTAMRMSLAQSALGTYTLSLEDEFPNLLFANISLQTASAADKIAQISSAATAFGTAKAIGIRTIKMSDISLVDLVAGDVIYVHLILRNSSN